MPTIESILNKIEMLGNKLPHPSVLFIWLSFIVIVFSFLLSILGLEASHPITQKTYSVTNLLSAEQIQRMLGEAVKNFTQFAPVGVVLVVMLGVGVAEHSGLIGCVLQRIVKHTSQQWLGYVIAFTGVLSSLGADVGYVVLIPLAGMIYHSLSRPALAGIAVAFAGVSAGFSANLFIGPVDVMLSGISTEAAHLTDPDTVVKASDNYYFIIFSTLLITAVCGWISNHLIEPRLNKQNLNVAAPNESPQKIADNDKEKTSIEKKYSLKTTGIFSVLFILFVAINVFIPQGIFHQSVNATSNTPLLLNYIVPVLAIYFALAGFVFGKSNGIYQSFSDAIKSMEKAMESMAFYIVLMFFAAQFVSYFAWSGLGTILAINGANMLGSLNLPPVILLIFMVFMAGSINLFIGSASAKWALLAPVIIPMLILLGIPAEQTQMAYRIGDSTTNVITPLMPYFGVVLAYIQRYQKDYGVGQVITLMLPYSISLLLVWITALGLWIGFGLPLGP